MNKEFLYSPWRLNYIESEKTDECILCRYQETDKDEENLIVYRGKYCYVMLNRYPYNNGHIMLVPYLHLKSLFELPSEVIVELGALCQLSEKVLIAAYNCEGINVGINLGRAAGAGIDEHLHIHMVPRWIGDSNFMSVIGGQRVIPEAFEKSWQRLHQEFINQLQLNE